MYPEQKTIVDRINRIRIMVRQKTAPEGLYEAATLAQTVLLDTVGNGHPAMALLSEGIVKDDFRKIVGGCQSVIVLFEGGALESPRLRVAREIEGDLLDIAETQAKAAEVTVDPTQKGTKLAIAAFLAGAALEDAMRRLCDKVGAKYDPARSSIAKLQGALYAPANGTDHIDASEVKQITTWGDTRNKADHGKFGQITQTEVVTMLIGVRAFIERHLP
jgi:hypothetical protein